MRILLLNAGSSSLKCSLVESNDGTMLARGLADWAGSGTRYQYESPERKQRTDDVAWKGHAEAVRRFVFDLSHAEPITPPRHSALAAVGHRIVHGSECRPDAGHRQTKLKRTDAGHRRAGRCDDVAGGVASVGRQLNLRTNT